MFGHHFLGWKQLDKEDMFSVGCNEHTELPCQFTVKAVKTQISAYTCIYYNKCTGLVRLSSSFYLDLLLGCHFFQWLATVVHCRIYWLSIFRVL